MTFLKWCALSIFTMLVSGCAYWFDTGEVAKDPPAPKTSAMPASELTTVRLRGSTTIGALLAPRLVTSFLGSVGATNVTTREGSKSENRIVVSASIDGKPVLFTVEFPGSQAAFECLEKDTCDIGMSSRPIKEEETRRLENVGDMTSEDSEHVLAMDGIAVIVNKANRVQRLTVQQVGLIFRREITNWSQVGGAPGDIHLVSRDKTSGTYDAFVQFALGGKDVAQEQAKITDDGDAAAIAIKSDELAIGFVGLPYVGDTRAVAIQDGDASAILPSAFSVSTEAYAFSRRLFLYTSKKAKNPLAKKFLDYVLSDAGQAVVPQTGFIALDVRAAQGALPQDAPDAYAKAVSGAQRLSFDFRFRGATTRLDPRSVRDVDRLARFLRVASSKARSVSLFGFTDSSTNDVKSDAKNVELSKQRAGAIATMLRVRGIEPQVVDGFGGVMQIAPNDSPEGRRKNRRVEVWVK